MLNSVPRPIHSETPPTREIVSFPALPESLLLDSQSIRTDELITLFNRILSDLEVFVPYLAADVYLEEAGHLCLVATRNFPTSRLGFTYPVEDSPLYHEIVQNQQPLMIDDVRQDSRFRVFWDDKFLRAWMGLPFIVNGTVQGLISIASDKIALFSQRDAYLAQTFINQAAVTVEKAHMARALAAEKHTLELAYQVSQSLTQSLDPGEVAQKALDLMTEALPGCRGGIYILDPANPQQLHALAISEYTEEMLGEAQDRTFMQIGVGLLGSVAAHGTPLLVDDVLTDPRWVPISDGISSIRSKVYIPLTVRNELIGVFTLSHPTVGYFRSVDLANLLLVTTPIALALQNARLFTAERMRRQEAEILRKATSTLILNLNQEQVLQELLERLREVVALDSACFMLIKGNQLQAVAGIGLPTPDEIIGHYFPIHNPLFRRLQKELRTIYYKDIRQEINFQAWGGTSYVRGWMGVPLLHRGILIGYLTLDSREVGTYGETEAVLAQAFANQATITIVNAQLLQDIQRSAVEQRTVSHLLRQLNATSTLAEIIPTIAAYLFTLSQCDAIELALFYADDRTIRSDFHITHVDGVQSTSHSLYHFGDSAVTPFLQQGRIHQTPNLQVYQSFSMESNYLAQGYTARISSPLQVNKSVLGAIHLFWRSAHTYAECNVAIFSQVADAIAMAVDKATLFAQTHRRAEEMEKLANLSMALRPLETRREIIDTALRYALETFQATQGHISFPAEDGKALEIELFTGLVVPNGPRRFLSEHSVLGQVYRTGQPWVANNILAEPKADADSVAAWRAAGYHSATAIFAPLHTGNQIIGVISMIMGNPTRHYSENDLHLLAAMAGILGTALHRSALLETLEQRVLARTRDLAEANLRLQELDRLKSEFVANVSHELRTPLTNIRFYLDLLNRGRPEKRPGYIQILEAETNRLYMLIESILDLSRLSAIRAQGTFHPVTFDMGQLGREIYQNHLPQAMDKGIVLGYSIEKEPLSFSADRNQIIQVMTNLLANSINYTTAGGKVTLVIRSKAGGVEIGVDDTGMGIEPEEQPHLFDRFYRGHRVTELGIPGTGLGLSIVKEIVDLHRGEISVQSSPGAGSRFVVWLPENGAAT